MSKYAYSGEMNTLVTVFRNFGQVDNSPTAGVVPDDWKLVAKLYCKWVNAHGYEVYHALGVGEAEPATLTMRYHPQVLPDCKLYRDDDPREYYVISVDNVENRNKWLEVKVSRNVRGR